MLADSDPPRPSYSFSSSTFASTLEDLPADTPAWEGGPSLPRALRRKTCVTSAQIVSLVRLIFAPFGSGLNGAKIRRLWDRSPRHPIRKIFTRIRPIPFVVRRFRPRRGPATARPHEGRVFLGTRAVAGLCQGRKEGNFVSLRGLSAGWSSERG